jgi:hypothetical protein
MLQENNLVIDDTFDDLLTPKSSVCGSPVVINLDSDVNRMTELREHFTREWNLSVDRQSAYTISEVSDKKFDAGRVKPYAYALCLSAAKAIDKFLQEDRSKYLLLLEDDCRFIENPRSVVKDAINFMSKNSNCKFISLGCYSMSKPKLLSPDVTYEQPTKWKPYGTHAVIINSMFAREYAEALINQQVPPDWILINDYRTSRQGYLRRPSAAYQEMYKSHSKQNIDTMIYADVSPQVIKHITRHRSLKYISQILGDI